MATEATHEHFEEHLLAREQFMIGGRDTAIVVWLALSLLLLLFLLLSGLAGDPPLPSTSGGDSAVTNAALTQRSAMNLR
jgi:hypothetical protein